MQEQILKNENNCFTERRLNLSTAKILCELAGISSDETRELLIKEAAELILNKELDLRKQPILAIKNECCDNVRLFPENSKEAKAAANKKNGFRIYC